MYVVLKMSKVIALLSLAAATATVRHPRSNIVVGANTRTVPFTISSDESLFGVDNTLLKPSSVRSYVNKNTRKHEIENNDLSSLAFSTGDSIYDISLDTFPVTVFTDNGFPRTPARLSPVRLSRFPTRNDRIGDTVTKLAPVGRRKIPKRDIRSVLDSSRDITTPSRTAQSQSGDSDIIQSSALDPESIFLKKEESEVVSHNLPADSSYTDSVYTKSIYSPFDLSFAAIGISNPFGNLVTRSKFLVDASKDYDKDAAITNTVQISSQEILPTAEKQTLILKTKEIGDNTPVEVSRPTISSQSTQVASLGPRIDYIGSSKSTGAAAESDLSTDSSSQLTIDSLDTSSNVDHEIPEHNDKAYHSPVVQLKNTEAKSFVSTSHSTEFSGSQYSGSYSVLGHTGNNKQSSFGHKTDVSHSDSPVSHSLLISTPGHETDRQTVANNASDLDSTAFPTILKFSSAHITDQKSDDSSGSHSKSIISQMVLKSSSYLETAQETDDKSASNSNFTVSGAAPVSSASHEIDQQTEDISVSHSGSTELQTEAKPPSGYKIDQQTVNNSVSHSVSVVSQTLPKFSSYHELDKQTDSSAVSNSKSMESLTFLKSSSSNETDHSTEFNNALQSGSRVSRTVFKSFSGHENDQQFYDNIALHPESSLSQAALKSSFGHEIYHSHSEPNLSQTELETHFDYKTNQHTDFTIASNPDSAISQPLLSHYPNHETDPQIGSYETAYPVPTMLKSMITSVPDYKTGQQISSSFGDLDRATSTYSQGFGGTNDFDGIRHGLTEDQFAFPGPTSQGNLAIYSDAYNPFHSGTLRSERSGMQSPAFSFEQNHQVTAAAYGGQELGMSDLSSYTGGALSGQTPVSRTAYGIHDTTASTFNQAFGTAEHSFQRENEFSGRTPPSSSYPFSNINEGYVFSSPSNSFRRDLMGSPHSLGKKLKTSLRRHNPSDNAKNEGIDIYDRFGLAGSEPSPEYLLVSSLSSDGHIIGSSAGLRSPQLYNPYTDSSSAFPIETHFLSSHGIHGIASSSHRNLYDIASGFEHPHYRVPLRQSPVSSGKTLIGLPGSYVSLDSSGYQRYDPQYRADSSIVIFPWSDTFTSVLPGIESSSTNARALPVPIIIQGHSGGASRYFDFTKSSGQVQEEEVDTEP